MQQLRKNSLILIILLNAIIPLIGEEVTPVTNEVTEIELGSLDLDTKVNLAITTPDYHVTPGDIYILNFFNSIISKSLILRVESNGSVNISSFGIVDTKGMLFSEFVLLVKKKIDASYEDTHTQISIRSVGTFYVQVIGEVKTSKLINVWGLTRLSSIVDQNKTSYTSTRNVKIINSHEEQSYDLFKAARLGELDQDPYLRPGDKIVLSKYERQVSIKGEIIRPGTYQLLPGDTLDDLITFYGDGLTPYADTTIEITKWNQDKSTPQYKNYLNSKNINIKEIDLDNLDVVLINSRKNDQQMVFFEGAVNADHTSIIKYQISNGELLSSAIRFLQNGFPLEADLENAYVEKTEESKTIFINLVDLLYNNNEDIDIKLDHNDRIIIPFRQYFVNIGGEVNSPGRYPYIPNRTWEYYVNMAGGFNNLTHS
ncbi:MAG: SLBB domain-containing protein, partial [Bacteroidota bacterium]|nr:SLBB domain-containing protein [Bacteroidota bacterium]